MRSRTCCIRRDFFQLPLILGCLCEAEGQPKHAKGTVRGAAQSYSLLAKAVTAALTSCRASSASPVHLKGSGATSLVISRACSRGQYKAQLQPVTLHWRHALQQALPCSILNRICCVPPLSETDSVPAD